MDKIEQALYVAEFDKFIRRDTHAIDALEERLMALSREFHLRIDIPSIRRRLRSLQELSGTPSVDAHYIQVFGVRGVVRYPLTSGEVVYKIPVFSFEMNSWKDHWTTTYLVISGTAQTLIDTGSHLSENSLREGLEVVRTFYGESVQLEHIDSIVITHAHLDHFGGLQFLVPQTHARLWVHEWDTKTIVEFPQEAAKGRKQIRRFLVQSGMAPEDVGRFMEMHGSPKLDFPGHKVTDSFVDGARIVGDFEVIHPPGHCPGLSCIRVGDVVMLGDPVLNNVSPHQFPKFFTRESGLLNYFNSLIKIAAHSDTVRLGLPSHYGYIPDVEGRAMEIMAEHNQRIADIVKDLNQPKNLHQISTDFYQYRRGRELQGYDSLLALEEIGAHLEFMMETLSIVKVTNPAALESGSEEIPLYQKTL